MLHRETLSIFYKLSLIAKRLKRFVASTAIAQLKHWKTNSAIENECG